jgi:cytochrome c5
MAVATKIFDAKRDRELIAAGTHFWCEGCITAQPKDDQSRDSRYCQSCCDFLRGEAKTSNSRAKWVPELKKGKKALADKSQNTCQSPQEPKKQGTQFQDTQSSIPTDQQVIMSTPAAPLKEVDIITAPAKTKGARRGPKHKTLPEDQIKRWAAKGMGSLTIANKLRDNLGINVSYKTIQRILNGKRQLSFPI